MTPASLQLALTDDELIARAMGALNGDKLQRLWSGDRTGYQSDSESDLALCSLLAFWCGPDQGRIDRLFRSSALMRPKWDERRGTRTYGELTIAKSLDGGEFWDPNARFLPEQSLANDPKLNDFALTDSGNAEAFAYLHAGNVVYDHRGGRWLIWSEHRWVADAVGQIHLLAKHTVRSRLQAAAAVPEDGARGKAAKHHLSSESRQRLEALLALARSEPAISDAGDRWDADPRLLAAQNGVIDLASGALRPGKPSDRITLGLSIPYDPEATCPRFERFLEEVFLGDRATIEFIQRAVGYSLTGDTTEHAFFLLYGTGRNGKSVLLNVLRALAGAYSHNLPFSAFELTARANLSPELAQLPGKRLVTSSETNDGTRLNEARIKALTGGDPITANPKYVAPFEFVPVAKFWLAVNHLPNVRDDSEGFWRRMRQIDFKRTFSDEEVDRDLERKLREELPGILTWAVRGAIEWHRSGLAEPEKVKRATLEYREQSDVLHEFISDRCVLSPNAVVRSSELYRAYTSWCDDCGVASRERLSLQAFGRRLGTRFVRHATKQGKGYRGIGLLSTVLSGDGLVSGDGYRGHLPELSPEQPREEEFWQKGSISVTSAISVTPPTCGNDCGRPVERQGELCDACLAEAVEVPREQRGGGMET